MSHEAESTLPTKLWGGGRSPFNLEYGKLMMWIFLLSDAFTFSGLLIAYGSTRYSFPAAENHATIPFGSHIEMEELHQYFTPSTQVLNWLQVCNRTGQAQSWYSITSHSYMDSTYRYCL